MQSLSKTLLYKTALKPVISWNFGDTAITSGLGWLTANGPRGTQVRFRGNIALRQIMNLLNYSCTRDQTHVVKDVINDHGGAPILVRVRRDEGWLSFDTDLQVHFRGAALEAIAEWLCDVLGELDGSPRPADIWDRASIALNRDCPSLQLESLNIPGNRYFQNLDPEEAAFLQSKLLACARGEESDLGPCGPGLEITTCPEHGNVAIVMSPQPGRSKSVELSRHELIRLACELQLLTANKEDS